MHATVFGGPAGIQAVSQTVTRDGDEVHVHLVVDQAAADAIPDGGAYRLLLAEPVECPAGSAVIVTARTGDGGESGSLRTPLGPDSTVTAVHGRMQRAPSSPLMTLGHPFWTGPGYREV